MAVILQIPRPIILKDIQLHIDVGLTQVVLVATVLVGVSGSTKFITHSEG